MSCGVPGFEGKPRLRYDQCRRVAVFVPYLLSLFASEHSLYFLHRLNITTRAAP